METDDSLLRSLMGNVEREEYRRICNQFVSNKAQFHILYVLYFRDRFMMRYSFQPNGGGVSLSGKDDASPPITTLYEHGWVTVSGCIACRAFIDLLCFQDISAELEVLALCTVL